MPARLRRPVLSAVTSIALAGAALVWLGAPAQADDPLTSITINEVESNGGTPGDWVELRNNGATTTDVGGLKFKDADDTHVFYEIPAGTSVAPGGFLVLEEAQFGFGLGAADSARLFLNDGTTSVDTYAWTAHATATYGRCPNGTGAFIQTASTKNAANDCPPTGLDAIRFNEVESNGDPVGDWAELTNISADPVDISGLKFKDGDDTHAFFTIPPGTTIAGNGYYVLNEADFNFGLGAPETVRLFQADEVTSVDTYSWVSHAATTYGRCPDGTGSFTTTGAPTKAAANNCAPLVRINEVESEAGTPADWVELVNYGTDAVDLSGLVVKDSDDAHSYAIPGGTTLAAGGYYVAEQAALGFELDASDSARLFAANGTTLFDSYTWAAHATTSYGRCPNGTGAFTTTQVVTKGALNNCPGDLITEAWPGGSTVSTVDVNGALGGDISGLTYDGSGSATPGVLWAVNNGDGALIRMLWNGSQWASDTANGWSSAGKSLKYADGTGTPDTEGVTVGGPSSAAGIYTATERNNVANGISKPTILRYEVSGSATTLTATNEWAIGSDLPAGIAANAGPEAIVWVPDSYLTGHGFKDESTGAAYNPATYPDHGNGLFFVGLEADSRVYAYALDHGTNGFTRIASFASGYTNGIMALDWEEERDQLWVVCDDTCGGRHGTFAIDTAAGATQGTFVATKYYERPSGMANLNNEGFTTTPRSECVGGVKPVFWSDDAATGGNALRTGTLSCTPRVAQTVSFTTTKPATGVVGQTYVPAATGGASGKPVTIAIASGSAGVCSITAGTVRFDHPGTCLIEASQTGNDDYAPGTASQSVTVTKALTTTSVSVTPTTIVATVFTQAPGGGTPTGSVDFVVDGVGVGAAPLIGGVASLAHVVDGGDARTVVATYLGSADHSGSSSTSVRRDPSLTYVLQPVSGPANAAGWYDGPVRVVFTCTANGSPLTGPCPGPVTLSASAAGQEVTRTVTAQNGGSATASTGPIDIDRVAPVVKVAGVRDGATYTSPPSPRCRATDPVSGVADCTVSVKKKGKRTFKVVVIAVDVAGNRSKAVETYRLAP